MSDDAADQPGGGEPDPIDDEPVVVGVPEDGPGSVRPSATGVVTGVTDEESDDPAVTGVQDD